GEFTSALMSNDEVIAVDQDPLGKMGKRITPATSGNNAQQQVWARQLLDGTMAVGLFNLGETPAQVSITLKELNESLGMNLPGPQPARDLWQLRDVSANDSFSAEVPRHGMVFLKIGTPRPEAECIAEIVKMHAPKQAAPQP